MDSGGGRLGRQFGAQGGDERRGRLVRDQIGEAAAAARQQRGDLDQPVVLAAQMRPRARPRPVLRALDEPRPDGFMATYRAAAIRWSSSMTADEKRAWKRWPVTRLRALTKAE